MNNKYLIAIGAMILVMVFFFNQHKSEMTAASPKEDESVEDHVKPVVKQVAATAVSTDTAQVVSSDDSSKKKAVVLSQNVLRQFSNHLNSMNKCLGLHGASESEAVEPRLDNLLQNLRSSLGDAVAKMDDYVQTEIVDKDSVTKRIRVDYDYIDGNTSNRRLTIYQMNAYGMPEITDLTADQSNNPNQAYVDSLIEGNKVNTEERGARVYFAQGEEVVFSMKNGILQNISINRADRSFNCFNLGDENSNCSCP
jgi:hypothetical protein